MPERIDPATVQRAPDTARDVWRFAGPHQPITVAGAATVGDELSVLAGAWPRDPAVTDGPNGAAAQISLTITTAGYHIAAQTPGATPDILDDPMDAANTLCGALIGAYVAQDSALLSLHSAGVVIPGGAVALMGNSLAGKSSVSLHLATAGCAFICDDRLVVRVPPGEPFVEAVSLHLAAKMRLPLPKGCKEPLRRFVETHRQARERDPGWDEYVTYLRLDDREQLPFAAAAPLQALILLERHPAGETQLRPASQADMVRAILHHGVAPHLNSQAILDMAKSLAARVPGYHLRFADSGAAAKHIHDYFNIKTDRP